MLALKKHRTFSICLIQC